MKPVLERFLSKTFAPDRFSNPLLLRGFYITSATQIGQPIDRVIASLAQDYGFERKAVATVSGASGRSYFLSDLLTKVVFPEAGIVARTRRGSTPVARYAAIAACIALPLAFGAGLWVMHGHNRAQAGSFAATLDTFGTDTLSVDLEKIEEHDFTEILPALDGLRDEALRLAQTSPPLPYGLGIDRTQRLAMRADAAYRDALEKLLRPRLMHSYEYLLARNLRGDMGDEAKGSLYDTLKTYLMLSGADGAALNPDYLIPRVADALRDQYPPTAYPEELASLLGDGDVPGHVSTLFSDNILVPRDMDDEAVKDARTALDGISIASRALRLTASSSEALDLRPWRIAGAGGSTTEDALIRQSGKPLDDGIPGFYTREGFWTVFVPEAFASARAVLDETWVLRDAGDTRPKRQAVIDEMFDLYYDTYIVQWRSVLGDLRIPPFADGQSASTVLGAISSRTRSPLKRILESIAYETALSDPPPVAGVDADSEVLGEAVDDVLGSSNAARLAQAMAQAAASDQKLGEPVADTFGNLRDYATAEGGADLRELIDALGAFHRATLAMSTNSGSLRLLASTPEAQALRAEASKAPRGIATMIEEMLAQANVASQAGAPSSTSSGGGPSKLMPPPSSPPQRHRRPAPACSPAGNWTVVATRLAGSSRPGSH